jgi:iron complex transport system ATP-binding protein
VTKALLVLDRLSWKIKNKTILSDISLTINRGQFVGIIGTNGAGKSSLLRTIYRYVKPTSGQIILNNQDIWQQRAVQIAQQIAVVQQSNERLAYSVFNIVKMGLTPHKTFFESDNLGDLERVTAAVAEVGLAHLANQNFEQLSGGEQQRTLIARAIVQDASLLIMDEPTNHLDVHYQIDILNRIKRLDKTVIVSLHDLNIASAFCDYLILLDQGKIIASGTPNQVLTEQIISNAYKVNVSVTKHPVHHNPLLTYHYNDHSALANREKSICPH